MGPWRKGRWMGFLVLAWVLLLPAALCAQGATAGGERIVTVGFAQDQMANEWRAAQVREVERTLRPNPRLRFVFTDAGGSTAQQILDIERLADQGVDLLITSPRDERAMTPVIAAVHRRGIPVVLLTRRILSEEYTTFVAPDDLAIGREAARHLVTRLGGTGSILVLQGVPSATTAILRTRGFVEEIAQHPGIRLAAVTSANYLRADALLAVDRLLASGTRFDALYAQSDSMAAGARMALLQAGIDPATISTVGIDYIPEARSAIRSGQQEASFTYPTCGRQGAELALRILAGEEVPKQVAVESIKVTRDNVERVEPIF